LRTIPAGTTISYGELAARIGRPAAVRAVGMANGANPVSVVVPCHRVIGSNTTLTGYGGGLPRQRWLLEHEKAIPAQPFVPRSARLPGFRADGGSRKIFRKMKGATVRPWKTAAAPTEPARRGGSGRYGL